jgi:glucose-1-phosphate thymidylyltransferase
MTPPLNDSRVGIIPAAGAARRISPLPCSKEILPLRYSGERSQWGGYVKTPIQYLLNLMQTAGVEQIYVVARSGKQDIWNFLHGGRHGLGNIACLETQEDFGVPFTVDRALVDVDDKIVLFGFPDILIDRSDAFTELLKRLDDQEEDVVLGVFSANAPSKEDLVELDDSGRVCRLEIKPTQSTKLNLAWLLAVWRPSFSRFIRAWTRRRRRDIAVSETCRREPQFGDVLSAGIAGGLRIGAVALEGEYLDIGTPGHLAQAIQFAARIE